MPSETIPSNTHIVIKNRVPKDSMVRFTIKASRPVATYIVRPGGLELFYAGKRFKYYGGFPDARKEQDQELRLPFTGLWYLIVMNRDKEKPAHVQYDVYA